MKGFKTGLSLINKHFIHSDFLPAALVRVYFVIMIRGDKFWPPCPPRPCILRQIMQFKQFNQFDLLKILERSFTCLFTCFLSGMITATDPSSLRVSALATGSFEWSTLEILLTNSSTLVILSRWRSDCWTTRRTQSLVKFPHCLKMSASLRRADQYQAWALYSKLKENSQP